MRNERAALPDLLAHLGRWQAAGCEIVMVDGGSQDGSAHMAQQAGFTVIDSPPGRARQMNAGAAMVRYADRLLFLHADTRLPDGADEMVRAALARGHAWGRFDVTILGRPALLRVVAFLMNWRSRLTGIATGDQAIFVRADHFAALGGFADMPLMEDIDLSCRLRRTGPPACLRARVQTSGRRWETQGVWRTIMLMWGLRLAFWLGVSPSRLARAYR